MAQKAFKIGHGYDIHPFIKGRKLVLGGVFVPSKFICLKMLILRP